MSKKKKKKKLKIELLELRRELGYFDMPKHAQEAKGQVPQAAMLAARDIVIGGLLGGLVGAAIGKNSPMVGLAAAGLAYYAGSPGLAGVGIGIALGGLLTQDKGETATERTKSFVFNLKTAIPGYKEARKPEENTQPPKEEAPTEKLEGTNEPSPEPVHDPLAVLEKQLIAEAISFQKQNGVLPIEGTEANASLLEDEQEEDEYEEEDFEDEENEPETEIANGQPSHYVSTSQTDDKQFDKGDAEFQKEVDLLMQEPDYDYL